MLLHGEAGSGKSLALLKLEQILLDKMRRKETNLRVFHLYLNQFTNETIHTLWDSLEKKYPGEWN